MKEKTLIKFSLPDSEKLRYLNTFLIKMLNLHKNWFYDDFIIESFFGCPYNCIWQSGIAKSHYQNSTIDDFNKIVEFFNKYNIKYRLVVSNNVSVNELSDSFSNKLLEKINLIHGYVTITSYTLYNYIKNKFPNIIIYWSILTNIGETIDKQIAEINKLSKNDRIVPPVHLNNSIQSFIHKNNIELLANQLICVDYMCPYYNDHKSAVHENAKHHQDLKNFDKCPLKDYRRLWAPNLDISKFYDHHTHMITRNRINTYINLGITHFKLIDRDDVIHVLVGYLHYLVKKEYRQIFISEYENLFNIDLSEFKINMNIVLDYYDNTKFN